LISVIIETNVLVAGLLSSQGAPAQLIDAWQRQKFALQRSRLALGELNHVLADPFIMSRLRPTATHQLLNHLSTFVVAADAEYQASTNPGRLAQDRDTSLRYVSSEQMLAVLKQHGDE